MASNSQQQQNQEYASGRGSNGGVAKSGTGGGVSDSALGLSLDHLHREFLIFIDLNRPIPDSTPIELDDHPVLPLDCSNVFKNKIETRCLMKDAKKRCLVEMEMGDNGKISNLDLNLRLSPSGLKSKDESSNRSPSSSSSSRSSCMSVDLNLNEPPHDISILEVPPLILMGCMHCLIYVMVSDISPKCPKCKGDDLLDIFRESPAKKTRKN